MARLGKLHAALVAREEFDSESFFELPYLPTERRLRDVQALRGLAEVQVLRHGNEIAYVTQFHRGAFYISAELRAKDSSLAI